MLAQQNMTSPSGSDESRRLRMLFNNRNMGIGKDGLANSVGDVIPNVGSPLQANTDMLIKVRYVNAKMAGIAVLAYCIIPL